MLLLGVVGYYLLYGTPEQRKKILVRLGVAAWLLMLGSASYCFFLPDPVVEIKEAFAEMKDLPPEQRRAKSREIRGMMRDLTPLQQIELGKERGAREQKRYTEFMELPAEEQVEKLRRQVREEQARDEQRAARRAASRGGRSGGGNAQGTGGGRAANGGGANGGGGAAGMGVTRGGGAAGMGAARSGGPTGAGVARSGGSAGGGPRTRGGRDRNLSASSASILAPPNIGPCATIPAA